MTRVRHGLTAPACRHLMLTAALLSEPRPPLRKSARHRVHRGFAISWLVQTCPLHPYQLLASQCASRRVGRGLTAAERRKTIWLEL